MRLLVDAGYDAFDLEELLFDPHLRQSCVQEILCGYGDPPFGMCQFRRGP